MAERGLGHCTGLLYKVCHIEYGNTLNMRKENNCVFWGEIGLKLTNVMNPSVFL